MTHARSAIWVGDPTGDYLIRRQAVADPFSLLAGEQPVLIDEWQDAPGLWDAVRMAVDRAPGPGQYLLTGSATPRDGVVSHSGTGRIARVRMWPMTMWEADLTGGGVSLGALLDGETPSTITSSWRFSDLAGAILRGGWPGTRGMEFDAAARLPFDYLQSVAYADATAIDGTRRAPARVMALLGSLARNTATVVTNTTLARDMVAVEGEGVSAKTVADYLDVLRRLYVLHEIPAWAPALRSPVRLRSSPKRVFCDPSLAAAGVGATSASLAADRKTLCFLFENLCLRDLLVYAQAIRAGAFYYRDETGLEVDAIIAAGDGRWMGIEVKLTDNGVEPGAESLLRLARKMTAAGQQPPSALVVVTGMDSFAHRRNDGVVVVPIDALEP